MKKKEITILKTWGGEEFIINISYEDFILFKKTLQEQGQDGFDSKEYRRFIKFASIEHIIGKTRFLSLEEPNKNKKTFTEKQKEENLKKKNEFIKLCIEKTEKQRKINFFKRRDSILRDLAKEEKYWGITTTLEKIEELNKIKKLDVLNSSSNI